MNTNARHRSRTMRRSFQTWWSANSLGRVARVVSLKFVHGIFLKSLRSWQRRARQNLTFASKFSEAFFELYAKKKIVGAIFHWKKKARHLRVTRSIFERLYRRASRKHGVRHLRAWGRCVAKRIANFS